jgi:hypothetical protein
MSYNNGLGFPKLQNRERPRNAGYVIAYIDPVGLVGRDGRFVVGDEIVNVNGRALRGLAMEEARDALKNVDNIVDLVR